MGLRSEHRIPYVVIDMHTQGIWSGARDGDNPQDLILRWAGVRTAPVYDLCAPITSEDSHIVYGQITGSMPSLPIRIPLHVNEPF